MNSGNFPADHIFRSSVSKTASLVLWPALVFGLILSVLSVFKLCNSMCSETVQYSVLGLDFGLFGTGFFCLMILMLSLHRRIHVFGGLLYFCICAAAGAELRLIWIQAYDIGTWCPVCLCIAAAVTTAALAVFYEVLSVRTTLGGSMKAKLRQITVMLVAILIGFGGALTGVQKEADAAGLDIYFGKRRSDTTVYFVSDWFCPVCRKIEPDIEKMFPELTATVRVAFVDMPIHPESANITPYHLQFMLYEKDKYIPLRHALEEITHKSKNPTQDQVQTAAAQLGVTLRPHNFMEILNGTRQFETIYRGFKVTATPAVVVDNTRTKKHKLLVGSNEITRNAIKAAIAEVEK